LIQSVAHGSGVAERKRWWIVGIGLSAAMMLARQAEGDNVIIIDAEAGTQ
jgi:hypothetical protein